MLRSMSSSVTVVVCFRSPDPRVLLRAELRLLENRIDGELIEDVRDDSLQVVLTDQAVAVKVEEPRCYL